jgi:A/G-specific adenine glycosylase
MRVIARLTADPSDIGSGATRARFQEIAQSWLDSRRPAVFNQAMMELGATVCLPRNPACLVCPVSPFCEARATGRQTEFPVKLRKPEVVEQEVAMAIVWRQGKVLMRQRAGGERRMAGFWELPEPGQLPDFSLSTKVGEFRHTIVNHRYLATVVSGLASREPGMEWVDPASDPAIPITTMAKKALELFAKCERVVQIPG